METFDRHMALIMWMLALLAIVIFVVAVRGPVRQAAWGDECKTLDNGGAIRLSYPNEPNPCKSLRRLS